VTFLGFAYGIFVARFRSVKNTMAWQVALTAALSSLGFFGASLSLHASPNLEMPVYGALFNNVGTALIAYSIGIMVRVVQRAFFELIKIQTGLIITILCKTGCYLVGTCCPFLQEQVWAEILPAIHADRSPRVSVCRNFGMHNNRIRY
jgi:hypothetical protein